MSEPTPHNNPAAACLVLHGLGGGPYEVAPLIAALREAGVAVEAPVLPGHEGPGPVMPASAWPEWAEAATLAFDRLAAGGRPVAVLGFSTGATLALHLATIRPVERLVLLAPFLAIRFSRWVPVRPATYLRWVARIAPNLRRRPPAARDPECRRRVAAISPFRSFSVPSALSALELIDRVLPRLPEIQAPALILQGRRDTVVEPAGAARLHRELGSADKRLVWYSQSDHLLALDREAEVVREEVLRFLGHGACKGEGEAS